MRIERGRPPLTSQDLAPVERKSRSSWGQANYRRWASVCRRRVGGGGLAVMKEFVRSRGFV
jgi:hypothetical protein